MLTRTLGTDLSFCGQDLATMVHEQGEIVDSIEQNIESTTVQVGTFFDPSSDYRHIVLPTFVGDNWNRTIETGSRLPKQGTRN